MAAAGESAEDIATTLGRNLNSVRRIMEGATPKSSGKSSKNAAKSSKVATKKPAPGRKPAKAAASAPAAPPPEPAPTSAPAPRARRASAGSSSSLTHHFWLRPGLEINLELPADLSADEAQRLASVIQSLPFHS